MEFLKKKIVVEFRYHPLLAFPDIVNNQWQPIIQNYDEISTGNNTVAFRDSQRCVEIFHSANQSGIRVENIDDLKIIQAELRIILELMTVCKIPKLLRVGVRTWSLLEIEKQLKPSENRDIRKKELIQKYSKHVLQNKHTVLSDKMLDFVIVEEGMTDNKHFRVQSGIVDDSELMRRQVTTFDHEDPVLSLLYDIDQYVSNVDSNIGLSRITKMIDSNFELSQEHLKGNHELFKK